MWAASGRDLKLDVPRGHAVTSRSTFVRGVGVWGALGPAVPLRPFAIIRVCLSTTQALNHGQKQPWGENKNITFDPLVFCQFWKRTIFCPLVSLAVCCVSRGQSTAVVAARGDPSRTPGPLPPQLHRLQRLIFILGASFSSPVEERRHYAPHRGVVNIKEVNIRMSA